MKSRLSCMVVVVGMALASMSAHAAVDWTWTLNGTPTGSNLPGTASAMGYSASSNTTALVATSGSGLPDMTWYSGSGFGICSPTPGDPTCNSPNHAVDNKDAKESIVLSFGSKVTLSWLDIGWNGGYDSDLSVLAYTGTGTPVSSSSTYSTLLANGWSLVGQYANVPVSTSLTTPSLNLGTTLSSSYWMIAAYNSTFGGACTGGACGDSNDYVKIFAVAGNTASNGGKVPEPAALLLFGTAIAGIIGLRRRRPD
ncbi:MAG: PEP-CTERM sorting domain-containing protein [Gammaproteobacteria bacterium]|nr:PEP-CTERM sorting domain-containing protein [Gammaproteobacteria bacterium]MBU3989877.1 PEP-CTERM sorting domain-containing protein [Gammaproteobacteria bacterium]MBU4006117.1 PEP-CTERM sorting domain-containing protein [Gammaproteobacteria bacterium]MBU4022571.1 PEP-CTERM sorting domain-containing protein [Gammaproteobacteria bacterium]MBU4097071.1 PEP-CTERM sorting domain-containing protein [Gammaproteobacteria bacterium]